MISYYRKQVDTHFMALREIEHQEAMLEYLEGHGNWQAIEMRKEWERLKNEVFENIPYIRKICFEQGL